MRITKEQREIAKIERFVKLGGADGALDALASHKAEVSGEEELPELILKNITGARNFWLTERQNRAGRRLYPDSPGIIGFNPDTIGQRGSLTIVELPDSLVPSRRTTRYLDTSGQGFANLEEHDFCTKAIATASHYYLSLATQVDSSREAVRRPDPVRDIAPQPA